MKRLVSVAVWVVLGLCLGTGCAARQRESYLRDRAAEHVYKKPLAEIWPRVKAVIDREGYYFEEAKDGYLLETDWKETDEGGGLGHSYTRLLVEGKETKDGGATIHVLRSDVSARPVVVQGGSGLGPITSTGSAMVDATHRNVSIGTEMYKHADRDPAMEWELLRAIDPEAAAALEKDAQGKYPQ